VTALVKILHQIGLTNLTDDQVSEYTRKTGHDISTTSLKLLHKLGLTNLTNEQIDLFTVIKICNTKNGLEKDNLYLDYMDQAIASNAKFQSISLQKVDKSTFRQLNEHETLINLYLKNAPTRAQIKIRFRLGAIAEIRARALQCVDNDWEAISELNRATSIYRESGHNLDAQRCQDQVKSIYEKISQRAEQNARSLKPSVSPDAQNIDGEHL